MMGSGHTLSIAPSTALIFDGNLYAFFPKGGGVKLHQALRPRRNFVMKGLSRICIQSGFLRKLWFGDWKAEVWKLERVVILIGWPSAAIAGYIRRRNPSCEIRIFCWNKIEKRDQVPMLKSRGYSVWTFDQDDALAYGINFTKQFYHLSGGGTNLREKLSYDAVFIGQAKHRLDELLEIKRLLQSVDAKIFFHIVGTPGIKYGAEQSKELVDSGIPYEEVINIVAQSRAIVDVADKGQTGLTLRTLEALFFGKKIITNSAKMRGADFYHADRVFIVERNVSSGFAEFLRSDTPPLDPAILESYSYEAWVRRFFTDEKRGVRE